MKIDLIKAKELLENGGYTCVLCKGNMTYTSTERGVRPLLQWLDAKTNVAGYSVADKVVGNAAAFLYVLLKVDMVYAPVMSEAAIHTLERHGIPAVYDLSVEAIRNRRNTGFCPMEMAVQGKDLPTEALAAIKEKLKELD